MDAKKALEFAVEKIDLEQPYTDEERKALRRMIEEVAQAQERLRKLLELKLRVESEIKSLEYDLPHLEAAFPEVFLRGRLGETSSEDVGVHRKRIFEAREQLGEARLLPNEIVLEIGACIRKVESLDSFCVKAKQREEAARGSADMERRWKIKKLKDKGKYVPEDLRKSLL